MKKIISAFLIFCFFGIISSEAFEYEGIPVNNKIYKVKYNASTCIDMDRVFMDVKNRNFNSHNGIKNHNKNQCLPYIRYIKAFERNATQHYKKVTKTEDFPYIVSLSLKINENGIEKIDNILCRAEAERCVKAANTIYKMKLPKLVNGKYPDMFLSDVRLVNKNKKHGSYVFSAGPYEFIVSEKIWEYKTLTQLFRELKAFLISKF